MKFLYKPENLFEHACRVPVFLAALIIFWLMVLGISSSLGSTVQPQNQCTIENSTPQDKNSTTCAKNSLKQHEKWYESLLLLIFLVGASGGVVATYFRLKGNNETTDTKFIEMRISKDPNAILQVYITPVVGGILAWVGHSMFAAGIFENNIFPTFCNTNNYVGIKSLFEVTPATGKDGVKAVVWAFIFGFSERIIPNIIDDLTSTIEKRSKEEAAKADSAAS